MASQVHRIRSQLLVLRCRRGEDNAFCELVALWERPLFYYVRRLVDREQDAWDVLQDVWLRVIRGLGRLRDLEAFPAWLYRIAHNSAFSHLRANPVYDPVPDSERELAAPEESSEGGFSSADAEAVHWALGRLSLADREVLTLRFLEGFSLKEIGLIAGVPPGTVKSRLFYAKRALQEILEKEGHRHE